MNRLLSYRFTILFMHLQPKSRSFCVILQICGEPTDIQPAAGREIQN